ncbi:MAG TPA: hypothetical protein VGP36_05775 [Mycobacteriales bacterium]|jgi:hypothetical protein|nr:hypothetical protein [Mycobacteriales bacterium]
MEILFGLAGIVVLLLVVAGVKDLKARRRGVRIRIGNQREMTPDQAVAQAELNMRTRNDGPGTFGPF